MPRLRMKNQKGMSFMEAIIALFLFIVISVSITTALSGSMSGFRKARALQKNAQAAEFMMNYIAKSLRTSTVYGTYGASSSYILAYDYSEYKCKRFEYDSAAHRVIVKSRSVSAVSAATACTDPNIEWTEEGVLSEQFSELAFQSVIPSAANVGATVGQMGKVTMNARVCSNIDCAGPGNDQAIIQTTVSLRDYQTAGI